MVWQLIQVGHIKKDTPLIFVRKMWQEFLEWSSKSFLKWQLANSEDINIPYCVNTAEEAIAILEEYHKKWVEEEKR